MAITVRCPHCEHLWQIAPQVLPLPLTCPECNGSVPSPMAAEAEPSLPIPPRRLLPRHITGGNGKTHKDYVEPADPAWYLFVLTVLPLGTPILAANVADYLLWKMVLVTVLAVGLVVLNLGVAYWRRVSPWTRAAILLVSAMMAYTMFAADLMSDPPPKVKPTPAGPNWKAVPTRRR